MFNTNARAPLLSICNRRQMYGAELSRKQARRNDTGLMISELLCFAGFSRNFRNRDIDPQLTFKLFSVSPRPPNRPRAHFDRRAYRAISCAFVSSDYKASTLFSIKPLVLNIAHASGSAPAAPGVCLNLRSVRAATLIRNSSRARLWCL